MSQAKVDKRKYEKVHRKEIERKKKIATAVKCVVAALIIGAIIGIPTGIRIYREMPKFVGDSTLEAFIGTYIDDNYASDVASLGDAASEDSEEDASTESSEDAAVEEVKDALEQAAKEVSEEDEAANKESVSEESDTSEDSTTTEASEAEE